MTQTQDEVETRKITRAIEVAIQPSEYAQLGKDAADVGERLHKHKEEYKTAKKSWNAKISELQDALDDKLEAIRSGQKTELVECEMKFNYNDGSVKVTDPSGALIEERPMTLAERQSSMFAEPGDTADESPDPETAAEPGSQEQREDIAETIREEQRRDKPSLTT